jgi:hypothetical protein
MPFDGSRQPPRDHGGLGLRHMVVHALRSIRMRVLAWRATHRQEALPDAVVIGTLRRPTLAIAMRATVVRTEIIPPPMRLEPWQADHRAEGTPSGDACRPYGTQIRWTPADVRDQMHREVRCHDAHDWEQYQHAIRPHARGAPHVPSR